MAAIHGSACVETDQLGTGVSIGEFTVVRAGAVLGDGVEIHSHVVVGDGVEIGAGTEVLPGTVIGRAPRAAGAISRSPSFERRLSVGPGCAIGANAVLYYDTVVGADNLIGDGASLLPGVVIGRDAVVGSGAVVTRDVAPGVRVMGVPARPIG
jgi:acetyltransferase-like isoleucine patch superfamily enzyme